MLGRDDRHQRKFHFLKCGNCETTEDTRTLCDECFRAFQKEGLDGLRWRRNPNEDGLPEVLISAEEAGVSGIETLAPQHGRADVPKPQRR